MNNTIALPELSQALARLIQTDNDTAEHFIRALFSHVETCLSVSDSVTVKGLGIFQRCGDKDNPVQFIPDTDLAKALNAPFEMFSPVELGDGMDAASLDSDIPEAGNSPEQVTGDKPAETKTTAGQNEPETESDNGQGGAQGHDVCDEDLNDRRAEENESERHEYPGHDETDTEALDEYVDNNNSYRHGYKRAWVVVAFVAGLIIGISAGYLYHDTIMEAIDKTRDGVMDDEPTAYTTSSADIRPSVTDSIEAIRDTIPTELAEAKQEIIYDTISSDRFLTTMARKYYGRMEYWAFIYDANKEILGHPNRIKPGTRVVIPSIDSISANETPEETLKRAKEMGREIYARY